MSEVVSEADISAYVDDQLDIMRRLAVEEYLARNPQLASRVLSDLRARDALRVVLRAPMRPAERPTIEAATRLKNRMRWRRIADMLRKAAAIVLLIGIGWLAHGEMGLSLIGGSEAGVDPPIFVADAIIAHRTEQMRRQMETQSHHQLYNPAEIEARLNIRIPDLPADWAVNDVQIFPSQEGDSVEASIMAASLGRISMFAARMETDQLQPPALARHGAETTVYWQAGHEAIALTTTGTARPLQRAGWTLFASTMKPTH
jgi:anti-sigma factor RsiW